MKKTALFFIMLIYMVSLTACGKGSTNTFNASEQDKKIHDDIAAENIQYVNISGNARSIIIKQGANEYFEFHNGDLNTAHTYIVSCDESDDTIDINIMMENVGNDNDVLGSVIVDIPQKEFEEIDITGDFGQINLHTINSDVFIHKCKSFVNLDLEAEHLEHNITLNGSAPNGFKGVSVYLDKFPENVKMDFNLLQDGVINDPQNMLSENRLESGSCKPVISINNTKEINIYKNE